MKRKLADCNGKIKEIERERAERRKIRKKTKASSSSGPTASSATSTAQGNSSTVSGKASVTHTTSVPVGELEDENVIREKEKKALEAIIHSELKADIGASVTGLFELCGNEFDYF